MKECVKVDVALVCAVKRYQSQLLKAGIKVQVKSDMKKRKKRKSRRRKVEDVYKVFATSG